MYTNSVEQLRLTLLQPLPYGYPWAKASVNQTNPYIEAPNTGVIRSYHFVLSRGWVAPDGVQKLGILINGQFPGPLIEANWGDTIQVSCIRRTESIYKVAHTYR